MSARVSNEELRALAAEPVLGDMTEQMLIGDLLDARAHIQYLERREDEYQEVQSGLTKRIKDLEARFEFEHELAESLQAEVTRGDQRVDDLVEKYQGLARRARDLEAAIRDIDAHATPLGGEEFVEVGYAISIGCLHRALALLGQIPTVHHTAHIGGEPSQPEER